MSKVYKRTENGTTTYISIRQGLDEINRAQMTGERDVRTMSSITRTDYDIEYKDGRTVRLIQIDGVCANQWEYGKDVCVLKAGHVGPHQTTEKREAWTFSWFDSEGAPAEQPEPGPKAWTGEATRIVTVKGKRYAVGPLRQDGFLPYVHYWSERNGKTVGATRSTSGDAKPGTVGRTIWDAVND
ncbi:hypothetical protein [Streptomyces huasconensis]|uniref:hypothetical protein n=1 Tax=Streptomyces huasconensis TaxID=1854574 RepID=UPI0036FC0C07